MLHTAPPESALPKKSCSEEHPWVEPSCAEAHRELRDPSLTIRLSPDVRRTQFSRTEPHSEGANTLTPGFPTGCGQLVDLGDVRGAPRSAPSFSPEAGCTALAVPPCLRRRREAKPNLSGLALSKSFFFDPLFFSLGSASALEAEDLGMLAHSAGCAGAALVKRAVNTSRFDSLVKGIFFGGLKIFRSSLISAECVAEPRVRRSHTCVGPTWAQRFGR